MIAEYTGLLAYNQGKIISVYAKQPASWVCASCLSEREDLCWAVKGCARIWWSNCKVMLTHLVTLSSISIGLRQFHSSTNMFMTLTQSCKIHIFIIF